MPKQRATYRGILERFRAKNGDKSVSALSAENIRAKMDTMAATPRSANLLLQCLHAVTKFALDRKLLTKDPTAGVKRLRSKSDGYHTWTDEQIAQFETRHPVGTKARLALALLLYTAQRKSDVIKLGRQHVKAGAISVRQHKTGTRLVIPIVDELREAIEAAPSKGLTFLETEYGHSFTVAGFGNWFRERCKEAGLKGCPAHGLRKAAARRLAEAGKSAHEIMAITGHKTLSEAERYTRAVDQEKLARRAVDGLKREPQTGKPVDGFASEVKNALKNKG